MEYESCECKLLGSGGIEIHNVPKDSCTHQYCSLKSVCWVILRVAGVPIHVALCREHGVEFAKKTGITGLGYLLPVEE